MKNIAVIGAGIMGSGIAHVLALHGFSLILIDSNSEQLARGISAIGSNLDRQIGKGLQIPEGKEGVLHRIQSTTEIAGSVEESDLVIEAVTENPTVKENIFEQVDRSAPAHTILASNTSSISITRLASHTKRPEKVIGMHFMNPVPVMQLVEVINGYATADSTTRAILDLVKNIGKTACLVNDYPGFVSNRILMPMINEAILTLQEGVATVLSIDRVMKLGMAHPMGPLQLADFIGLDTCLSILRVLHEGFGDPKYAPSTLLINMVSAGRLGIKTGEGFYRYTKDSKDLMVSPRFARD